MGGRVRHARWEESNYLRKVSRLRRGGQFYVGLKRVLYNLLKNMNRRAAYVRFEYNLVKSRAHAEYRVTAGDQKKRYV